MARTTWAFGTPFGGEAGPVTIPADTEIAGIDGAEQYGHGIVDIRIWLRKSDGSDLPGTGNSTGWLTGLAGNANFIGSLPVPAHNLFTGFWVQSEAGFGVVNFRLKMRDRASDVEMPLSGLVCGNTNQNWAGDTEIPIGKHTQGVLGKVQAGYGIVDLALEY